MTDERREASTRNSQSSLVANIMEDVPERSKSPPPAFSREKSTPFLIRSFIKIGGFHRLSQFEDGTLIATPGATSSNLPNPDEQQIFTWKDATLREILTTLRSIAPKTQEYRHPLARYSFRSVYFDSHAAAGKREPGARPGGHFASKDLGIVYSRDILGDPGSAALGVAPRLLEDYEPDVPSSGEGSGNKTLEELKFHPGDFLSVAVLLPKSVAVMVGPSGEVAVKNGVPGPVTSGGGPNGWKTSTGVSASGPRGGDSGWGAASTTFNPSAGRGGGHWRGESNGPSSFGRGRGGGRRDRDDDFGPRRVPPPRRDSPPRRGGRGGGARRRSRDSRSRSPARRNPRYD